jgi:hypothetical protein
MADLSPRAAPAREPYCACHDDGPPDATGRCETCLLPRRAPAPSPPRESCDDPACEQCCPCCQSAPASPPPEPAEERAQRFCNKCGSVYEGPPAHDGCPYLAATVEAWRAEFAPALPRPEEPAHPCAPCVHARTDGNGAWCQSVEPMAWIRPIDRDECEHFTAPAASAPPPRPEESARAEIERLADAAFLRLAHEFDGSVTSETMPAGSAFLSSRLALLAAVSRALSAPTPGEDIPCGCECSTHPEGGCSCGCDCRDGERLKEAASLALAAMQRNVAYATRKDEPALVLAIDAIRDAGITNKPGEDALRAALREDENGAKP